MNGSSTCSVNASRVSANHALSLCSSRPTNHLNVASVNPLPEAVMMDPFGEAIDDPDASEHCV